MAAVDFTPTEEFASRFWAKVKKTDGCWLWTAHTDSSGYGKITVRFPVSIRAHRASWIMRNGPIPDGLLVCHKCDVPRCVNPEHLFLGTAQDNMSDAEKKGRMASGLKNGAYTHPETRARGQRHGRVTKPHKTAKGEHHGRAKITASDVHVIRSLAASGINKTAIARQFGLGCTTVRHILSGKNWKHI